MIGDLTVTAMPDTTLWGLPGFISCIYIVYINITNFYVMFTHVEIAYSFDSPRGFS
jgi:hypothetical protein